jgi:RNA polymerase sigma-70 factor, ECF subfamily
MGRTNNPSRPAAECEVECKEVLEQLSDYVDAETRAELCRQIEDHLARCSRCKVEVDTVKKMIMIYHSNGPSEAPVRVSAMLASALAAEYRRPRPSVAD